MAEFKVIGKSYPRIESIDKVTGKAKYAGDKGYPELPEKFLYGKILGSPHHHAIIKSIDTSKAESLPGVKAVITYKDCPPIKIMEHEQRPTSPLEKHIRYLGEPVAAVAAETPEIAEEALSLIDVEYEVLPAVFDPEEATKPEAPKLWPDGNIADPGGRPIVIEWGDIEKGFASSDVIVEESFVHAAQPHAPLQLSICTAAWNGDQLTVWVSTQTPSRVWLDLSKLFSLPMSKVRVINKMTAGSQGYRYSERYMAIAALLSKKAHAPVKIELTRKEEIMLKSRYSLKQYIKAGAKNDGTLMSIHWRAFFDVGGYGHWIGGTIFWLDFPIEYIFPNARFEGYDVNVNLVTKRPFRSVPYPGLTFGIEQVIDELAEKVGMDPIEFRLKNTPRTGSEFPTGKLSTYDIEEVFRRGAEMIGWKEKWKGFGKPYYAKGSKRRAVGLAYTMYLGEPYGPEYGPDALLTVCPDGSIDLQISVSDIGTGTITAIAQVAAEEFGVSIEDIRVSWGDTSNGLFDLEGANASREAINGAWAVIEAAKDAKDKIARIAAPLLGVKPEEVEISNKKVFVKTAPEKSIPLNKVLKHSITGSGHAKAPPKGILIKDPVVQFADVEVDLETGEVTLLNHVVASDIGKALNPAFVECQLIGGATTSMGYAISEEPIIDKENRAFLNANYLDYKVLTSLDIPKTDVVIIESHEPYGPYGAKAGVGEQATANAAAAIANAIYNAIGVRIKEGPITPDRILKALGRG